MFSRLFLAILFTKTNNLELCIRMNCFDPQVPESTLGLLPVNSVRMSIFWLARRK